MTDVVDAAAVIVPVSDGLPVKFKEPLARVIGLAIVPVRTRSPPLMIIAPGPGLAAVVLRTEPPLTVRPPLNVLEPERISVPGPFCVIPAFPLTTPGNVSVA